MKKEIQSLIDHSQMIDDIYESLEDYNPRMKRIEILVFNI